MLGVLVVGARQPDAAPRADTQIDNHCHQMFGSFSGTAVLDDGARLNVKDVISFAEHAVNNW